MEQQTQAAANTEPEFAALVGIDWADKKHYWSLSTGSGRQERGTLDNTPEAVEVWMMELLRRFDGRPVAVALEQRKGALVVMLGKYEHAYLCIRARWRNSVRRCIRRGARMTAKTRT